VDEVQLEGEETEMGLTPLSIAEDPLDPQPQFSEARDESSSTVIAEHGAGGTMLLERPPLREGPPPKSETQLKPVSIPVPYIDDAPTELSGETPVGLRKLRAEAAADPNAQTTPVATNSLLMLQIRGLL